MNRITDAQEFLTEMEVLMIKRHEAISREDALHYINILFSEATEEDIEKIFSLCDQGYFLKAAVIRVRDDHCVSEWVNNPPLSVIA